MFFTLIDIWLLNDIMWNLTIDPHAILYVDDGGVHVESHSAEMVIRAW